MVGNFLCYTQGSQGHPAYNLAFNLFRPEKQAVWGDTVLLVLPNSSGGQDTLKVGGCAMWVGSDS